MTISFEIANNWNEHESLKKSIPWKKGGTGGSTIYVAVKEKTYKIRINDFPNEPLYTLLINEEEVIHFDDWPVFWKKPM